MKVLVCGGRDYEDWESFHAEMLSLHRELRFTHIIHGDARGADRMADRFALMYLIQPVRCPANWMLRGKGAGPSRNASMLRLCPDLVIACPGGVGTADMVAKASLAGIQVRAIGGVGT